MNRKRSVIIGGIFIASFWLILFLTSGSLWNGFHFIDDHDIVVINHNLNQHNKSFFSVLIESVKGDIGSVRFRPLWITHKVILTKFLGLQSSLWLQYNFFVAILTTFLLFVFGLLIGFSFLSSLLLAFLTIIGPQSAIYYRLGTPETFSTLLLSISLVFIVLSARRKTFINIYEILFLFATIGMVLTKENYVLMLPTLVFIKIWQYRSVNKSNWRNSIQDNTLTIVFLSILFVLDFAYINHIMNSNSGVKYADNFGYSYERLWSTLSSLNNNGYWQILLVNLIFTSIIIVAVAINGNKLLFLELIPGVCIFMLIVIPQIFTYAKSGIYERYLIPGVLGYSFLISYTYNFIQCHNYILIQFFKINFAKFIPLIMSGILIFQASGVVWENFNLYSLQRKALNELLTIVESHTQANDKILVVINPRSFWEFGLSLKEFLNYKIDRSHIYLSSYGSLQTDFYTPIYKEAEAAYAKLDPKVYETSGYQTLNRLKNKESVKLVIIFPPLKQDFLKTSRDWFFEENFQEYSLDLQTKTDFPFYIIKNTTVTIYSYKK